MRKSLFFPLTTYPDATPEQVVGNAADFAAGQDATVTSLVIDVSMPNVANPLSIPLIDARQMALEAEGLSRSNGLQLDELLRESCKARSVDVESATVRLDLTAIGDAVAAAARLHDLTLVAPGAEFRPLAEAVIFGSGRPVLLVPRTESVGAGDHVAIAWDGGRAAARALGDAMWLVEAASRVSILFAGRDKAVSQTAAGELSEAFGKRGIPAELRPVDAAGRGIGDALQAEAIAAGAKLMVMGGFGHSRMRDFVLGGATAGVLSDLRLPVLISH